MAVIISSTISRDKLYKKDYIPDLTTVLEEKEDTKGEDCYYSLVELLICIIETIPNSYEDKAREEGELCNVS